MAVETKEELEKFIDEATAELIGLYDIVEKKRQVIDRARAALKALELGWEVGRTVLYAPNAIGQVPMLFKEIRRSKIEGDDGFYALCVCINPDGSEGSLVAMFPIEASDSVHVFQTIDAYFEQYPPLTPPEEEVERKEPTPSDEELVNASEIIYSNPETEVTNESNQQRG